MIRKAPLLLLFLTLSSSFVSSQKYNSNLEKEVFSSYQKDSINYPFLKSLFVIDTTFKEDKFKSYVEEINGLFDEFSDKQKKERKEKKRIKAIYDAYHKKFLKKYDVEAFFPDIFKNGHYNCVTATALYAYVFEQLKIPYKIKEVPSHVFIIAYPNTYNIHLETTAPGAYGFFVPKESEIKKIVDKLVSVKLVTENELISKGYKKIYEDYFYGKDYIRKSALIGIQYYNNAIFDYQNKNYIGAENNFLKSFTFYNSPLGKVLYKNLILVNLENLKFTTIDDINRLVNALSILEYKTDFNKNDIKLLSYKIIDNDSNSNEFISKSCEKLSTIENEEVRLTFQETIYSHIAKSESNKLNFDKSLVYGTKLLDINPNNKVAKEIIIYSVSRKLSVKGSSKESLEELESYYNKYSFLKNDKRIETTRAIMYGEMAINELKKKNIDNSLHLLEKLEIILDENKQNLVINPKFYPYVFLNIGRHFYGRNKYKKALEVFGKGLKYAPSDPDLKKMFKWAKEDSGTK